ncbi:pyruvate:ferredoxin (flavodoxin) oxidoreductase [Lactonifactor longoviformis]|uniref:Pyruvate:ferredoxin oxidoreductase n=1 Tax=Lactonifactor longoviformis DSM 17459 TaxID=1122155 RepID=A0A1M4SD05_9CLOT|nr:MULTISPECIES: pyruvate:ferredoxin (flavodoxin) oxidoreductase [Lactonifactor]MCQ4672100.1 pyruvate:ferredoxin (flavodoxin) oxidoreductase [Lactonifactor longoviformis]MRZ99784.1 pyruvate:ferredoxin (flavodoxin) oxidoreductase [Lactonifactor sp. BIOML-A5]MSA08245.1 pyruvate:ferredoxin (flavodoxin) oxidoreductase [Lactonifactor sp. BIOML-A4]MSA11753.1 pyruvate:ferredoxin (flavodoxin) oxidoreductase [Lactonifactor sp. BIOML-A3]MSA15356.1 pyruvate:ferredoxin (flavodoxin) oxidoreductase [Lactoni
MARKMKTMDGNHAAAHASYAFTDVAAIYPITPSSVMAEATDEWATQGRKNIFGQEVQVTEMQSEAGAAGTVHGSLAAGALTTTYTASQGLLLMIPNLYKIAGEQLPGVFNVSARALASHALSIFGDHSDVYACRQTGCAMLCESSVQEVMDLTPVAHCAAIKGKVPFINFFDGFRTSHEIQKIETWDYEDLKELVDMDAVDAFRTHALNPNHPCQRGSAQNPDIFFQAREACNPYYNALPAIVQEYMDKVNAKIGTDYKLFNYYGAEDAEHVIIAMGSACDAIEETIDYLTAAGEKVGVVKVRLYRPFCAEALINAIPDTVKQISVLDRTKEPGSLGEPLYLDVVAALKNTKFDAVPIFSGRYGLGSKDTTPAQIVAVYKNTEKKKFTIGIVDDVTNLSLETGAPLVTTPEGTINCKFWGLGADGTVGANKNSIKIIGDNTDMYAQAYFDYDSKKSGGVTMSHLRFGKKAIKSTYLIHKANFVACHNPSYVNKYNMVQELVDGGTFLLNCPWDMEGLEKHLPGQVKSFIANHGIKFYIIDGIKIGKEIGLGGRINTVLQSAFFKLANIIPEDQAIDLMKAAAKATYGRKGDKIVQMNYDAIDAGAKQVVEIQVPESWKSAADEGLAMTHAEGGRKDVVDFVNNIQSKVNAQEGNSLPVSAFTDYVDGSTPSGSSAYEKRGIAVDIPVWNPDNCIQCNRCAYVCPHAVIRPIALTEEEAANAPEGMKTLPMTGMADYKFAISISAYDCTGCGSCANVCPGKKGAKALAMENMEANAGEQVYFDYTRTLPVKEDVVAKFKENTVKGSQFKQPLLEFSGACAGCGETPYAKLITQLFGDRMYIANATGCSSIWGNSSPSTPYTVNAKGQGPAWCNSLFEDNAEFGYGMLLAQKAVRNGLKAKVEDVVANGTNEEVKAAGQAWLDSYNCGATNGTATDKLIAALEACGCEKGQEILKQKDFLAKKSQWIFGGDGWAYDIGFGGVDHVLASGQDINIMVFDTEVYSNTGGQSSKSTPTGAVAQFAAGGKEVKKKDLASIAMSYGYVYVAQIAMGADYNQTVKAIAEAEAYPGPSLIIAYAPCINHGIKKGMSKAQTEEELAVKSGYWHCFRFNPELKAEGKPAFSLDSKAPTESYQEFLDGEVRYNSLKRSNPEKAAVLFEQSEKFAKERYEYLNKLITLYGGEN